MLRLYRKTKLDFLVDNWIFSLFAAPGVLIFLRGVWSPGIGNVSQYLDGQFVGDAFLVSFKDWTITVKGDNNSANTRISVPYSTNEEFEFEISRSRLFSLVSKFSDIEDIDIGDAEFDRRFFIESNNPARIRELFDDPNLRYLFHSQPSIHLKADLETDFWKGRLRPDVVILSYKGFIKDPDGLISLIRLFEATLDRLNRIGLASDAAPQTE